jgi:BON domain
VDDALGGIGYVRAHLTEALATDPRVTEGGLRVVVDGDELVVTGSVSTEARRQGVAAVAAEVAAPFRVRNETHVVAITEPGEVVRE